MDAGFWIEIAILVLRIFAAGIAGCRFVPI